MYKVTIPMRLPGLNEYIASCNSSRYKGNALKQSTQADIAWFIRKLPKFHDPIRITFIWVSTKNDRRDLDNICFAKKFILDAMQICGKITNDNRKKVVDFRDIFAYGNEYQVILEIEEIKSYKLKESTDEKIPSNNLVCAKHNGRTIKTRTSKDKG